MADDARSGILGTIRRAVEGQRDEAAARAAVADRLARHARNVIPLRAQLPPAQQVELFQRMAQAVGATVELVTDPARVPHMAADYLSNHNLPARVRVAPDPLLQSLPWDRRPMLEVAFGRATADDQTSLTTAVAGVAETGTLMLASGPDQATTLAFLPTNHVVLLPLSRLVGTYEEGWDMLRARGRGQPRTVNFVTGPSRTADIEQTPQVHAHGPGRLHILLLADM